MERNVTWLWWTVKRTLPIASRLLAAFIICHKNQKLISKLSPVYGTLHSQGIIQLLIWSRLYLGPVLWFRILRTSISILRWVFRDFSFCKKTNFNVIQQVDTRAYPELLDTVDTSTPIWVIILAVIGGLLVFALIAFIMWRCGFFRRKRPDLTLSGNLNKKSSETKPFL